MRNLILILLVTTALLSCNKNDNAPITPVADTLGIPVSVVASITSTQITVSWAAPAITKNITGYKVYSGSSATTATLLVTVAATGTLTYVNSGLITGNTYFYYITSTDGTKESNKSIIISAIPQVTIASTVSMLVQQYLPYVCKAAPARYYDVNNVNFGKNTYAKTDTFKLFIASTVLAGNDTTFFLQNFVHGVSPWRSSDNIVAIFPEKSIGWVDGSYNNTTPYVNMWLWSGDNYFGANQYLPGVSDTIPFVFKLANLKSLTNISTIWVRASASGWFTDRKSYNVMYDQKISINSFKVQEGFTTLDKSTPTIYHVNGSYYVVVPIPDTQGNSFHIETTVNFTDKSCIGQMLIHAL